MKVKKILFKVNEFFACSITLTPEKLTNHLVVESVFFGNRYTQLCGLVDILRQEESHFNKQYTKLGGRPQSC